MVDLADYKNFLSSKVVIAEDAGFGVDPISLNPANFAHQNAAVHWAASMGKALIAMSFGLGKTRIQCELAQLVHEKTNRPFLVICPLGVKYQFSEEDGPVLGMRWQYVKSDEEMAAADTPYLITNYERVREGNITRTAIATLGGVSLDEGSVLRSLGSKTQLLFNAIFRKTPYRYVATATPSPNNYREILNYANFLGVMDRGQALTRWFQRNPDKAGDLQLHPRHAEAFWLWVSSWALFVFRPSDLGYPDDGYVLPELKVYWHRIATDHTRAFGQVDNYGQHRMFLDGASGVSEASTEVRFTLPDRMKKVREILASDPDGHWLLWHHYEIERHAIEHEIPQAVTVYGSQDIDVRERRVLDFTHGRIPILASKPELSGSGCNFQYHCHNNIFMGVNYKFQDFIQAIHRTYRFQQKHDVSVHIIYADSQDSIVRTLQEKWKRHGELVETMRSIVLEYGLSKNAILRGLNRRMGVERMEAKGKLYKAANNDCVAEMALIEDGSIDMIASSIPFSRHYEYSDQYEDFGHNSSDERFWQQMDFLIPNLLRVLKPGRICAIHAKDLIHYSHQNDHGFMEVYPFTTDCIQRFRQHGFLFLGKHTITTDVVRENNTTNRLGYSEMCRDATKMGAGLGEELLIFRKKPSSSETARADVPVTKDKLEYSLARWQIDAHQYWRSNGDRHLTPDELYDYQAHVGRLEDLERRQHLPHKFMVEPPKAIDPYIWDDINPMLCLNSNQSRKQQRNHICPLPFDIVERAIQLYSNIGDLILDPFAGLFTVPYIAIKLGRRGYGIELNAEYFSAGVKYCHEIEQQILSPTLFDYLTVVQQAASAD